MKESKSKSENNSDANQSQSNRSQQTKASSNDTSSPVRSLQNSVGNQVVQRLVARGVIQAQLEVSSPNDESEREAERVARAVMRMSDSKDGGRAPPHGLIDTVGPHVGRSGQRQSTGNDGGEDLENRIDSLKGGGRPLPDGVRSEFEGKMGQDFSDVRVHTDTRADEAARSIDAQAFTHGTDIVFRSDTYDPRGRSGKKLLAHELTHVVQQTGDRTVQRQDDGSSDGSAAGKLSNYRDHLDELLSILEEAESAAENSSGVEAYETATKKLRMARGVVTSAQSAKREAESGEGSNETKQKTQEQEITQKMLTSWDKLWGVTADIEEYGEGFQVMAEPPLRIDTITDKLADHATKEEPPELHVMDSAIQTYVDQTYVKTWGDQASGGGKSEEGDMDRAAKLAEAGLEEKTAQSVASTLSDVETVLGTAIDIAGLLGAEGGAAVTASGFSAAGTASAIAAFAGPVMFTVGAVMAWADALSADDKFVSLACGAFSTMDLAYGYSLPPDIPSGDVDFSDAESKKTWNEAANRTKQKYQEMANDPQKKGELAKTMVAIKQIGPSKAVNQLYQQSLDQLDPSFAGFETGQKDITKEMIKNATLYYPPSISF